jgi:hypothetical protein
MQEFSIACDTLASPNTAQRKQAEEYLNAFASKENATVCLPVCRSILQQNNLAPVTTFHALSAVKLIVVRDYNSAVASEWLYFLLDSLCSLSLQFDSIPQFVKGGYLKAMALIVKRSWLDEDSHNEAVIDKIFQMSYNSHVFTLSPLTI